MIVGLGCPNAQWRTFTAQEEAAILDLRPQGLLLLAYPDSPVLSEKVAQEARLWEALGRPQILLRPYASDMADRYPREWARVCVDLWRQYASHGIQAELVPANELNKEGLGNEWRRMADWLINLAEEVFSREPGIVLHLPALSPGVEGYLDGWEYFARRQDLLDFYPIVDCHIYSSGHLADLPYLHALFGRPLCITEFNFTNWT